MKADPWRRARGQAQPPVPALALVLSLALSIALLPSLSACGSVAPERPRPAAPLPDRYPTPDAGSGTAAADLPWAQFFADAQLQRLIETALRNNRDLRLAVLNIEQARAAAQARDADLWPTVNAGITGTRQPTASGGVSSLYTAGVQVSAYEVDLFHRVRSLGDAAAAQVLASVQARQAVQISLVGSVASAYIALLADEDLLRVTRQTLQTRQDTLQLTRLRFDNGAASLLDLRSAESLQAAARVGLAQLQRQQALDGNALALLLGQADAAPAGPPGTLEQLGVLPDVPAGLPSDLLTRRPDVRQAEALLLAADANIGAARAAFFPRLTLTGSLGSVSGALSGLFKSGSGAWALAPQLLGPVFDAGRNRAALRGAQVAEEIALAQYDKTVQTAFREVADALAGRTTLQDQLQAQNALLQAELGRQQLTELRYRSGASSALELLDAQRSVFAAQLARVQLQAQVQQNAVTLYRVLGGGWTAVRE